MFGKSHIYTKTLDCFVNYDAMFKGNIEVSQDTVANRVGVTRQTLSRYVKQLCDDGLLQKDYRWWLPSKYAVAPLIKKPKYIQLIGDFVPSLRYFITASLSLSLLGSQSRENVSEKNNYTTNSLCISNRIPDRLEYKRRIHSDYQEVKRPPVPAGAEKAPVRIEKVTKKKVEYNLPIKKGVQVEQGNVFDFEFQGYRLTVAGMTELSCFPAEAICYARGVTCAPDKKNLKDPFRFLYATANRWCKEKGISPDYGRPVQMKISLGIGEGDPKAERVHKNLAALSESDLQSDSMHQKGQHKQSDTNKSPQRGAWRGHYSPDDVMVEMYITPEQVEENVKQLEQSPFFQNRTGKTPRDFFAKELRDGEKVIRSQKELDRQQRAIAKHNLWFEELRKSNPVSSQNMSNKEPESNTINEKGDGNGNGCPDTETFNQFYPGLQSVQPDTGNMPDFCLDRRPHPAGTASILQQEPDLRPAEADEVRSRDRDTTAVRECTPAGLSSDGDSLGDDDDLLFSDSTDLSEENGITQGYLPFL